MSLSRSMAAMAVLLLLLVVGLAACGSTDTAPADPGSADTEPAATGSADSFFAEAGLPADAAVIEDAEGDVRDVDGSKPPEDSQAADIIQAGIYLSDTELMLAVEHAEPVPSTLQEIDFSAGVGEWLSWMLFIADQEGVIVYMPQVGLGGSEWKAYAYDKVSETSTDLDAAPGLAGSILTYSFPRDLMPDLAAPFKWGVGVTWQLWTSHEMSDQMRFGDQATQDDKKGWSGYPYEWADYPLN